MGGKEADPDMNYYGLCSIEFLGFVQETCNEDICRTETVSRSLTVGGYAWTCKSRVWNEPGFWGARQLYAMASRIKLNSCHSGEGRLESCASGPGSNILNLAQSRCSVYHVDTGAGKTCRQIF